MKILYGLDSLQIHLWEKAEKVIIVSFESSFSPILIGTDGPKL